MQNQIKKLIFYTCTFIHMDLVGNILDSFRQAGFEDVF